VERWPELAAKRRKKREKEIPDRDGVLLRFCAFLQPIFAFP
jgi:hypothetical protein